MMNDWSDWLGVPAEDSEHQVEHKKRPDNDERHEIGPCEIVANRVVRLHKRQTQIFTKNLSSRT